MNVRSKPLDTELVRKFVVAAHGDFEKVKQLVTEEPALIHSIVNWGGSDWESGLGAAAHTGNRSIAEWLLERGARLDIFAAAMLGELGVVSSIIERFPEALQAKGPHGIPLIRHAEKGGEQAKFVVEYLKSKEQLLH